MKKSIEQKKQISCLKETMLWLLCHTMQELAMTDKYARFIERNILLDYMVTFQRRNLEMRILLHQMELKEM